jgi:hypothetical protein
MRESVVPAREGIMGKSILGIVVVLLLAGLIYVGYNSYDAKREATTGAVFSNDPSPGKDSAVVLPTRPVTPAPAATDTDTMVHGTAAGSTAAGSGAASGGDTISANPPNGMTFSGTGKYQLYRQGNITWRLDTDTGQTCVLFATDEEWRKPKVFRAGCAKN